MKHTLLPLLALAFALNACGGAATSTSSPADSPQSAYATVAPAREADAVDSNGESAGGTTGSAPQPQVDDQGFNRMVIKTADMSIQVEDVRALEAALRTRIGTLGGYIVQSQSSGSDKYLTMNISFRVPSDRFEEALSGVQGMAKEVLSSAISGDDVTEEFVDLDSRRQTLEATRDRLRELLARAETVEDTLKVTQTLTEYQVEIDQITGRQKFLSQSAAMSTINLAVSSVPAIAPIIPEEGWQPVTIARDALRDLVEFGQVLMSLAIVLLIWSPVWGGLLLFCLFLLRRLRGGPKTPKSAA